MKHLLTLLLLLPAFCTATAGGTNIPGAILAGARTSSAPAGAINTGEETLQRLQLLACTEDELLEGYPEDRVDYSVKLRNPNAVAVTGELSLELFDTAGNYIGAPAGAYKTITLEAGEEQTVSLILFLPPSGEERRVSICFTPFEDTPSGRGEQYSFGYFDMKSKTVAEGAPRLSLVSAEPATPRFAAGGKTKAKVTIKNTGGYFSNTSYSQNALEYVILAKKINLNGTNLTNIPLYETESLGDQPVRIDKDETATVEIELGTEVFARKQLSSIVKMYDPDFSMQPGEYFIAVIYRDETNNNAYTSIDLVPFLYEETEPNRLYAPEAPVRARTGTQVTLPVNMENPTGITGFQFDLHLPAGVTCATDGQGHPLVSLGDRTDTYSHTISSADRGMTDGSDNIIPGTEHIRVLCYSTTNEPFASHDGALISIPLTAAGDLRDGVHEIQLKNIIATTVKAVAWGLPDNRVSVLSGNLSQAESLPELQGHFTAEAAQALSDKLAANSTITSVSLVQATDIAPAAGIRTGNPNTLIYVPDNRTMANKANIVSGTGCTKLELTDGYPFHAPTPFTAAEATYSRQPGLAGWHTLCLPFAAETPAGLSVERFESLDEARHTVAFKAATGVSADTPCIFHTPTAGTVVFSATDAAIAATPATLADGALKAAYRPTDAGALAGKYVLNPDGTAFSICDATVFSPAFCAWLDGGTDASAPVYTLSHGNTPTGIEHATGGSPDIRTGRGHVVLSSAAGTTVSIVSAAGQTVRTVRLRPGTPQTVVLPAGVYLAEGRKFVIR